MSKGKYAAKAANRAAALDNDIIVRQRHEIEALKQELKLTRQRARENEVSMQSELLHKAEKLAEEQIQLARDDAKRQSDTYRKNMRIVAEKVSEAFVKADAWPLVWIDTCLPLLLDSREQSELIARFIGKNDRWERRHSSEALRRGRAKKSASDNIVNMMQNPMTQNDRNIAAWAKARLTWKEPDVQED